MLGPNYSVEENLRVAHVYVWCWVGRDYQPLAQETEQVKEQAQRTVHRGRSDAGFRDTGRRAVYPGWLGGPRGRGARAC